MVLMIESNTTNKLDMEHGLYQIAARIAQLYKQYLPDRKITKIDHLLLQGSRFYP